MNMELQKVEANSVAEAMPLQRPTESALVASVAPTISPDQYRAQEVHKIIEAGMEKAGTLVLTEAERTALTAHFPDAVVELKRDDSGKRFAYIPHIYISNRLCDVFGPGGWTIIRRQMKAIEKEQRTRAGKVLLVTEISAEWVMIVRGVYIGESWGQGIFYPNNPIQSFRDVIEGTRGECIRSIAAKYLNCGSQPWEPSVQRRLGLAAARERLEIGTPSPNRAPSQAREATTPGLTSSTMPAPVSNEKPLKVELWSLCRPLGATVAKIEERLTDWRILSPGQHLTTLNAEELQATIEKVKVQTKIESDQK